jgi:anti-anti-sigma regulatory factor
LSAPGLFLTAAYCLLDTERREVTIASAGHTPLYWLRGGGIEKVRNTGPALGLDLDARFGERRIPLDYGDALFFYTDGLYDAVPGASKDLEALVSAAFAPRQPNGRPGTGNLGPIAGAIDARDDPLNDDVTILLLGASPGLSVLDNGQLQTAAESTRTPGGVQTLVGRSGRRMTFRVLGRGDWTQSAPFHVECAAAIEKGFEVVVDLSLCTQLDSTYLGTMHELCSLADAVDVGFRLQGVSPHVEDLFVELGMERVRDHIVSVLLPVPGDMQPIHCLELDRETQASLLLRAHEGLAALNEKNREAFEPVVRRLRDEVAALSRGPSASPDEPSGR